MELFEIRSKILETYGGSMDAAFSAASREMGITKSRLRHACYGGKTNLSPREASTLARLINVTLDDLLPLVSRDAQEAIELTKARP